MPPKKIRPDVKVGNLLLRLVEQNGQFIGVIFGASGSEKERIEGTDADRVWRELHDAADRANPRYFGFDGAHNRFLRIFSDGFYTEDYARPGGERDYKVAAKAKLDATVSLEQAVDGTGFGEAIYAVFQMNQLLSHYERPRVGELLRGPHADAFVRAAARFSLGEGEPALGAMANALRAHDAAKWTAATYLPFLWRPEAHMFLKPEVTKDFAERVGHRFFRDYEPALNIAVYDSLLDLAARTMDELADLKPRDRIDVQSFIWVVGAYEEPTHAPGAAASLPP
jgi:hypothetical protein